MNWFSNETVRDWIPVFAPRALGYLDRPDAWNISHAIQELYFKSPSDSEAVISKLITDRTFLAPTRLTALLHSKRSPAYLYSFDKPGTSALVPFLTLNSTLRFHCQWSNCLMNQCSCNVYLLQHLSTRTNWLIYGSSQSHLSMEAISSYPHLQILIFLKLLLSPGLNLHVQGKSQPFAS